MERTLAVVKPDGVRRGLIGEIIRRFEKAGLKIVALKMLKPTEELAANNYPDTDEWFKKVGERSSKTFASIGMDIKKKFGTDDPILIGKTIKGWLVRFLSSGNVVAMVLEGNRAADNVRRLVGETDPLMAQAGTIRGDLSIDNVVLGNSSNRPMVNVVHASGNAEEAKQEIKTWFNDSEILEYNRANEDEFYRAW